MKKRILPILLLVLLLLSGCGRRSQEIESLADMKGKALAIGASDDADTQKFILEACPKAELVSQNDTLLGVRSVADGKIDAYVVGRPYIERAILEGGVKGVKILEEPLHTYECGLGLSKTCPIPNYKKSVDETVERLIADGIIEEMRVRWIDQEKTEMPEIELDENPTYTLNAVTFGESKPFSFFFNGELSGFDVELVYRICEANHWGLNLTNAQYPAMLMGLGTGKYDMLSANLYITAERGENIDFSVPYKFDEIGVAVRSNSENTVNNGEKKSFLETLETGLKRTFVTEERWRLIVSGLIVTLLITLGGFLLANILGAAFCACTMSKKKGLRIFADVYDRIMQGTPMVVILMILYYVIFGKSNISGIWVAIIAFGLNSGASLAQQFCGAITGVDKGQTEAALSIGFTKYQTFTGIVFPQAARAALSGYFSTLIALMKGTSIVGYIAVIDLTKSGDLIRSSTYDAFFPLLSVALIYFLISFGLLSLLKYFRKKLEPKRIVSQEVEK